MQFWHMQIKEGEEDPRSWEEVKNIVIKYKLIGLDLWNEAAKDKVNIPLNKWSDEDFDNYDKQATLLRNDGKESIFARESLKPFCREMKIGDIVLVRFGQKPICLAKIKSNYFMDFSKDEKGEPWFRHRRKVDILYEFNENAELWPSPQKTLQKLVNPTSPSYLFILKYLKEVAMQELLKHYKQIILYGPPGTGKTYRAKQITAKMLGLEPEAGVNEKHPEANDFQKARFGSKEEPSKAKGKWALVQFHPSYNYEDFVRGITVTTEKDQVKYEVKDQIFVQMCKEARDWCKKNCSYKDKNTDRKECPKNECAKYILIIDEINRANLAAVLGELIYALEYRREKIRLPYGDEPLEIPENLYIIGTMNTADRSIGHIDYAVRRRFAFVQVLPDKEVIGRYYEDKALEKVALTLFEEVEKLFGEEGCLSPDYHKEDVQPGHSYFLAKNIDELAFKFAYQVWPLLREYCKDGVLLCESENCKIELNGQEFKLKEHLKPEDLIEAVHGLLVISEEESPEESQKENETESQE